MVTCTCHEGDPLCPSCTHTQDLIDKCLAKPQLGPYTDGHIFNPQYRICARCRRTEIDIHANKLRCKDQEEGE